MTGRDRRTPRVVTLAVACLAAVAASWIAHGFGRAALGSVGGILVGFVAAMMSGAAVYVLWELLLAPAPTKRPAGAEHRPSEPVG